MRHILATRVLEDERLEAMECVSEGEVEVMVGLVAAVDTAAIAFVFDMSKIPISILVSHRSVMYCVLIRKTNRWMI